MKSPSHKFKMSAYEIAKNELGLASLFSQMVRSYRWLRQREKEELFLGNAMTEKRS